MTFSFQIWGVLDMIGRIVNPNKEKFMKKVIRTYKTSELYIKLYGRAAYEAWKAREAEIDALIRQGGVSCKAVIGMREDNFRKMKASGKSVGADRVADGAFGKVSAAA